MCQREAQLVTTHVVFSAQSKSSVMSACPLPYSDCLVITLIVHVNDCPSITPSCIQNVRRARSRLYSYPYKVNSVGATIMEVAVAVVVVCSDCEQISLHWGSISIQNAMMLE